MREQKLGANRKNLRNVSRKAAVAHALCETETGMSNRLWRILFASGVLALSIGSPSGSADEWPGYLGLGRDGLSAESGLLTEWPEGGPEVLWRAQIGIGFSSVAVAGGRAFTMLAEEGQEWVAAFDARSGEASWRSPVGRSRADSQGGGPRATPTVDGGRVFALGAFGNLFALDAATGETIWQHDLRKELGADVPNWGVASSPLVEGGKVIVPGGGGKDRAFLAFDSASGELVWSTGRALPAYASPIAATIGGIRQIVFFIAAGLVGVAEDDGRQLWSAPWTTSYDVNAATPLFVPKSGLFVSSGYDTGAALLQIVAEEGGFRAYQLWRNRSMRNTWSTSIRVGQYLYGFDESILKCLDVLTGEVRWRGRAGTEGTLIYADEQLIVLGGDGTLRLVAASPEEFRAGVESRISNERTWAAPALSDGVLYVRSWKELVALRVGRAPEPAPVSPASP
jgi:outer membrane protein assembly factor BamB